MRKPVRACSLPRKCLQIQGVKKASRALNPTILSDSRNKMVLKVQGYTSLDGKLIFGQWGVKNPDARPSSSQQIAITAFNCMKKGSVSLQGLGWVSRLFAEIP